METISYLVRDHPYRALQRVDIFSPAYLLSNVLWSSLAGSGDGSVYAWNVRSGKVQKDISC